MAFKLTYTDGRDDDYDDSTKWAVDAGVLKMGREEGNWTVLVSPSHWATIEVGQGKKAEDQPEEKDHDAEEHEPDEKDHDADR